MKWYPFNKTKGCNQKRPPLGKWVLGKVKNKKHEDAEAIVVCYRKDAAGDKHSPYFVTPGCIGLGEIYEWCDGLMDGFDPYPMGCPYHE